VQENPARRFFTMSSTTLYRLSGGTLIVGSLLILINTILNAALFPGHSSTPQQVVSLPWVLVTLTALIGSLLFVIGLPGMYLRQAGQTGTLGLVGFILLFFGILLQGAVFSTVQVIILPFLAQKAPQLVGGNSLPLSAFLLLIVSGLMYIIGAILLGIATMRSHVFPRWAGVLILVAGIAMLLTLPPLPEVLSTILEMASFTAFSIAFLWCSYTLIVQKRETVEVSPLAAAEARMSR